MNFWKLFFASLLGTVFGIIILFLILFAGIIGTSGEPEPYIRSNTVLTIPLSGTIPARSFSDPLQDLFQSGSTQPISLEMLKSNLEKAAADDNISGIWLQLNLLNAPWANLETAYNYLQEFRESGKFIYASTDDIGLNEKAYFLATAADSVFSPPHTGFEFNGFSIQTFYLKNLLEKIGVQPEIVHVGEYKSAIELFLNEESSPENREQLTDILNNALLTFTDAVERKSGLSSMQIDDLMNEIPDQPVRRAHEYGLIDVIALPEEFNSRLRERVGIDEDETLRTVSVRRYNRVTPRSAGLDLPDTNDRIAVIYASGMIIPHSPGPNFGGEPVITAEGIKRSLDSALDNDDVKAIVIHINSNGGSPSSSDLIWHHLKEASLKKPVVAYLGSVAASGGYYIAMGADRIISSPNTITGSIGVIGTLYNTEELFNENLGINFEEFKTHEHSDLYHMTRALTPSERQAIQRIVESTYETFLQRVSENREMTRDEVDAVARGRIWTGSDAKANGLVDETGDLDVALAAAAELAGIETYRTIAYPERRDLMELIFSSTEARVSGWIRSMIPFSNELHAAEQMLVRANGFSWMLMPAEISVE